MPQNYRKQKEGLNIFPKTSSSSDSQGDLEVLSTDGKLRHHNGTTNSPVVTEAHSATLTNKTIDADQNTISNIDNADIKAGAAIARDKLASGNANRVVVNNGTGVVSDAAAITANRALQSDANGIPTHSSVTDTELGYVSGVTSSIQTQLNTNATDISNHIADAVDAHDASAISNVPSGNLAATDVQSALNELQSDIDTRALSSDLSNHISDTTTHGTTGDIVGTSDTQTLSNKSLEDSSTYIVDNLDNTKKVQFQVSGVTTATTRTLTVPDANTTIVGTDVSQTLTNKILSGQNVSDYIDLDSQGSDPASPSAGKLRFYEKSNTLYTKDSSGTVTAIGTGGGTIRSEIFVYDGNGHGSTNNKIRRFVTTQTSTGTDISYSDSATLGGSFTINSDGIYAIQYADGHTSSSINMGLSVNSTELTTNIVLISLANYLGSINPVTSGFTAMISVVRPFSNGDVIRAHTDGTPNITNIGSNNRPWFRIVKINN